MVEGKTPQQIIDLLVANDAENDSTIRQYGVVDLNNGSPRSAAFTGSGCFDEKFHRTGPNYSIQGNILIDSSVVDSIESRFLSASGDLATRLMYALQGANMPGADSRCLNDGKSSLSSFIRVAKPTDTDCFYLDLNVNSTPDNVEPIDSLQTLFDGLKNNCEDFNPEISTNRDTIDFLFLKGKAFFSIANAQVSCAEWNISDGATSTDKSYLHQFDETGTYTVTLISKNYACVDTSEFTIVVVQDINNPNSIDIKKSEERFKITPNPSYGEIGLEFYKNHGLNELEVYSVNGKLIYKKEIINRNSHKISIDSKYRKGNFIIKLHSDDEVFIEKVTVL